MKPLFSTIVLLVILSGCDRRDDPDVSADSQGVSNPPGETVGSTEGTLEAHHPPESALESTMPAVVPARCKALTGGQLARCVKEEGAEDPPPAPQDASQR